MTAILAFYALTGDSIAPEHARTWGAALVAVGLALLVVTVLTWVERDLGTLDYPRTMRIAIPAVLCTVLGLQTIQFVFFAGVLAFFNFTKPDLWGKRSDATFEGTLSGLKTDEQVFAADEELVEERLRVRSQFASVRYGIPIGEFFKVMLVGNMVWNAYDDSDEARDAAPRAREGRTPSSCRPTTASPPEGWRPSSTAGATA